MHDQEARRLLALIESQRQVVSRDQALRGGMSPHAVAHRLRPGGPWRTLLPGVYQTATGTPTQAQREIAALLYAGPGSVITGSAALRHHRLPDRSPIALTSSSPRRHTGRASPTCGCTGPGDCRR